MPITRVSFATRMAPKARVGLLLLVAGCTADKGAHFNLTGNARKDWKAASAQVLTGYCGVTNPTSEQIAFTAVKLREINERHLREDLSGFQFFDLNLPAGVDHRYPRRIPRADSSIFVLREICPTEKVTDAGAPDAGIRIIDLDNEQIDAGAKDTRPTPAQPVYTAMPVAKPRSTSTAKPPATGAPEVPTL